MRRRRLLRGSRHGPAHQRGERTAARREAKVIKNPWYRNSGRRLNLMPTSTALGCVQCPLNSNVIGTNYDGTTAGKIRLAPRNSLYCPAGGLGSPALAPGFRRPGRNHRAGGGEPLFRPRHRGLRSRRLFHRRPAVQGLPDFEVAAAGAVWRFRNEGNRASFVAHPEIYGPQFGGYDPVDLARGVTYAGNPRFWLVNGQRLYLFGREEQPRRLCRGSRALPARTPRRAGRRCRKSWRSTFIGCARRDRPRR